MMSVHVVIMPTKFCPNCGAEVADEKAVICIKCGVPFIKPGTRNRTTAILLALFLGGLGVHQFYLGGKWWWVSLLFCWTFIPAIVAIFEVIQLAMMSDEAFNAKYNSA